MAIKRLLPVSALTIGAASTAAQIVLLREFIVVFYGNEISVGFILAAWLFSGAAGSMAIGKLADRIAGRIWIFCAAVLSLSFLPHRSGFGIGITSQKPKSI